MKVLCVISICVYFRCIYSQDSLFPKDLKVIDLSNNGFKIVWTSPVTNKEVQYDITLRLATNSGISVHSINCEKECAFHYDKALPNETYYISVYPVKQPNERDYLFLKTLPISLAPKDLEVTSVFYDGFRIEWISSLNNTEVQYNITIKEKYNNKHVQNYSIFCENKCSFQYNDSTPNETYLVSVYPVEQPEKNDWRIIKTSNFKPSEVTKLKFEDISTDGFVMKWEQPLQFLDNLTSYIAIIEELLPKSLPKSCNITVMSPIQKNTTKYFMKFDQGKPYTNYTVTIYAEVRNTRGINISKTILTKESEPDPPTNITILNGTSTIDLQTYNVSKIITLHSPCNPNGNLKDFEIRLTGRYTEDKNNNFAGSYIIPYTEEGKYKKTLSKLNASYIYNYEIVSLLENGKRSKKISGKFDTPVGYPDKPIITKLDETNGILEVKWESALKKVGKITRYLIKLEDLGTIDNENCNLAKNVEILTEKPQYTFTVRPYRQYKVSVSAMTQAGKGNAFIKTYKTTIGVPEKVSKLQIQGGTKNISTSSQILLTWKYGCQSNGPFAHFEVLLKGRYTENETFKPYNETNITKKTSYEFHNLRPSYIYDIVVYAVLKNKVKGKESEITLNTKEDYPYAPEILDIISADDKSNITWKENSRKVGKIIEYEFCIGNLEPADEDVCEMDKPTIKCFNTTSNHFGFKTIPYYKYNITLRSKTNRGYGEITIKNWTSLVAEPDHVRNITYCINYDTIDEAMKLHIKFDRPCRFNGKFETYRVYLRQSSENETDSREIGNASLQSLETTFYVKPAFEYYIQIFVKTSQKQGNTILKGIKTPAGVPKIANPIVPPSVNEDNGIIEFKMRKDYFSEEYGSIEYYGVLLYTELSDNNANDDITWNSFLPPEYCYNSTNAHNYTWNNSWPNGKYLTDKLWNPFTDEITEVIVRICPDEDKKKSNDCIYEPLEENTQYYLKIRAFTESTYGFSKNIPFKTGNFKKLGTLTIVGIVSGSLLVLGIAILIFLYKLRDEEPVFRDTFSKLPNSNLPVEDALYKCKPRQFPMYWKKLQATENGIKDQFDELTKESQDLAGTNQVAQLSENRRKNRYINILPFDSTRVLLPDNDYINASYVKGRSGHVEYIACQGPMERTCKDFWKMVVSEKVSIIVMVTQFFENKKDKCYEYFPNMTASLMEEDMCITCVSEEDHGDYCLRILEIEENNTIVTIEHFQFLNWPDFGVPNTTQCLINFCKDVRKHYKCGKILVHCSAGVGRTGTFITLDINLSLIDENKDIDIYNTILDLRKQRVLMVQTCGQYEYIHKCIADYLTKEYESSV